MVLVSISSNTNTCKYMYMKILKEKQPQCTRKDLLTSMTSQADKTILPKEITLCKWRGPVHFLPKLVFLMWRGSFTTVRFFCNIRINIYTSVERVNRHHQRGNMTNHMTSVRKPSWWYRGQIADPGGQGLFFY